jgi:CelD/BcsL family acetyltransferase involved in cellulose biosynthesis
VTVRGGGGLLVGLLPLMIERRRGAGRLLFLGTGITDYLDILARGGWEGEVARAGGEALASMGGWSVADLQELRPEAAAWALYERWEGGKVCLPQSNCPLVKVERWEEMLACRSKNLRSNVRRTLRKAEGDALGYEMVGPGEAEEAGRRLVALHRRQWQDRNITSEHATKRFESHVANVARRVTRCGIGTISELRRGEEVAASSLLLFGDDFVCGYLDGSTEAAWQRYQISSLRTWNELNIARDRGAVWLDMLRGEEEYKGRWSSKTITTSRMILGRRTPSWLAYAGYHVLRSKAKRYATSEGAPPWVERFVRRLKGVRSA